PPGPPPGWRGPQEEQHAPPPGPSATQHATYPSYAPPPGPPPSYGQNAKQSVPSENPPPYHDWTVIPDTALLPPPPSLNYDVSPTANASADDGERAFEWCNANPLWRPHTLTAGQRTAVAGGQVTLVQPGCYTGELLPHSSAGRYKGRTHSRCRDSCLLTGLPLYSATADSPLATGGRPKTIYFELRVLGVGGINASKRSRSLEEADAGIALGFVAPPYPPWRLPGWQRGSLGVHGDDGRRYVNDTFGGVDFTTAFQPGETVGLGMRFAAPRNPPAYGQGMRDGPPRMDIDVFFTRGGKRVGGWDLHEELDERAIGGAMGLEGECDLFGAVGVFGGVDFEVFFNERDWLYRP
ncbi:uncharacterized protein K452DRAFT_200314, partial [Aplosporella prunicola CBS 121167]